MCSSFALVRSGRGFIGVGLIAGAWLVAAVEGRAITITLDYTYDTTNFFGAGNPSGATAGAQAKAALEAVAGFYSGILTDTFDATTIPPDYYSQVFGGIQSWDTQLQFTHPSTGGGVTLNGQTRALDEYRVYVGARELGSTLGTGGPISAGYSYGGNGGFFTFEEVEEIEAITDEFIDNVTTRGQGLGFSAFGGVLSFDRFGTTWHYNHTTAPGGSVNDFYSVAIHELGHALGLGASDQWAAYAGGPNFTGPAATAEYGSAPPLNGARDHWADSTMSTVFGTATVQEAAMDPQILEGTRKYLTDLDAAALVDLGWEVEAPTPNYHPADFNTDGSVNGGDYTAWKLAFGPGAGADADDDNDSDGADFLYWQRSIGQPPPFAAVPEPGAIALMACAIAALAARRR